MKKVLIGFGLALQLAALGAGAHEYKAGDLQIGHPYALPSLQGVRNGQGFFSVENKGSQPDTLLSATTPAAGRVEVHEMKMDGGVMKMRELPRFTIAPGQTATMAPGANHLMLMDLKAPLKAGDKFPMTLRFVRAGEVQVDVVVQEKKSEGGADAHQHHGH